MLEARSCLVPVAATVGGWVAAAGPGHAVVTGPLGQQPNVLGHWLFSSYPVVSGGLNK